MNRWLVRGVLHAIQAWDGLRIAWLRFRHPGLELHPAASTNFASCDYSIAPGARLVIGPGAVTERRAGGVRFVLEAGARVEIGERVWLRSELGPVRVVAFAGAEIELAPEAFLNGCHVSAKRRLRVGRRSWIGPGSRVFDSDQHDLDDARPEGSAPVEIGDHVWIASDVTVLRGVRVGHHSVVGARSVVTRDVPDHTLVLGAPARRQGTVGDRSRCR